MDDAFASLRGHYESEESIFVKTPKFVSLNQAARENDRDCLPRAERLSRDIGFGDDNKVRTRSTLVLAINGLRDALMRKEDV